MVDLGPPWDDEFVLDSIVHGLGLQPGWDHGLAPNPCQEVQTHCFGLFWALGGPWCGGAGAPTWNDIFIIYFLGSQAGPSSGLAEPLTRPRNGGSGPPVRDDKFCVDFKCPRFGVQPGWNHGFAPAPYQEVRTYCFGLFWALGGLWYGGPGAPSWNEIVFIYCFGVTDWPKSMVFFKIVPLYTDVLCWAMG